MKVGDLVWHVDDIRDDCAVPGLVMKILEGEVVVRFGDRNFDEYHNIADLRHVPTLEEDENIMGNPDESR